MVATVNEVCKQYNIQKQVIVLACDNVEALQRLVDLKYFISPRQLHFDVLMAIIALIKISPIKWMT